MTSDPVTPEDLDTRMAKMSWEQLKRRIDFAAGVCATHAYPMKECHAIVARLREIAGLVRSHGCVRCLRTVIRNGPSTTHPHVTSDKLDTLTALKCLGEDGRVAPLGRAVAAVIGEVDRG